MTSFGLIQGHLQVCWLVQLWPRGVCPTAGIKAQRNPPLLFSPGTTRFHTNCFSYAPSPPICLTFQDLKTIQVEDMSGRTHVVQDRWVRSPGCCVGVLVYPFRQRLLSLTHIPLPTLTTFPLDTPRSFSFLLGPCPLDGIGPGVESLGVWSEWLCVKYIELYIAVLAY